MLDAKRKHSVRSMTHSCFENVHTAARPVEQRRTILYKLEDTPYPWSFAVARATMNYHINAQQRVQTNLWSFVVPRATLNYALQLTPQATLASLAYLVMS